VVSVQLRGRSKPDGELRITVPPELAGHELLVTVTELTPDSVLQTEEWPDGLFERTAGQWQGPPLRRESVKAAEVRDPLI
jgi:hypothetical protein